MIDLKKKIAHIFHIYSSKSLTQIYYNKIIKQCNYLQIQLVNNVFNNSKIKMNLSGMKKKSLKINLKFDYNSHHSKLDKFIKRVNLTLINGTGPR